MPVVGLDGELETALCRDPRRMAWWEIEDVVANKGPGKHRRYLVRYKGLSAAFDEWRKPEDVPRELIQQYHDLLTCARPGSAPVPVESEANADTSPEAQAEEGTVLQGGGNSARGKLCWVGVARYAVWPCVRANLADVPTVHRRAVKAA